MRISKFSSIYEVCSENNFYYIFRNNILNDSYFLDEKEFNLLKEDMKNKKSTKNIKELQKSHIIVPKDYSEEKFLNFIKTKYSLGKPLISIFYLTFNNECNLGCKYCYVEGSYDEDKKDIIMNRETFNQTIDFLERFLEQVISNKKASKEITFIYYGSEPLMTPKYVKESIEKIKKLSEKLSFKPKFQVITNATLITDDLIKFFKKNNVELAVSIDGPEKVHDSMRVYKNSNKGTYEKVEEAIKKLSKEKITFGVSCTIGPHNIDVLKENIEFFKKIGSAGVGFNILLDAKNMKIPFVSINKSNDKLIEASELASKKGFFEDRVQRKVKSFNKK